LYESIIFCILASDIGFTHPGNFWWHNSIISSYLADLIPSISAWGIIGTLSWGTLFDIVDELGSTPNDSINLVKKLYSLDPLLNNLGSPIDSIHLAVF